MTKTFDYFTAFQAVSHQLNDETGLALFHHFDYGILVTVQ